MIVKGHINLYFQKGFNWHYMVIVLFFLQPFSAFSASDETECRNLFSDKRITLVVPYSAGGGYDSYARLFAPVLESYTGARVRIRNLTGAGGALGIRAVAEARPENLTLGIFDPLPLLEPQRFGPDAPSIDSLVMLGSFITDTAIVVGRQQDELLSNDLNMKVIGIDTSLVRTLLASKALNWNVSLVRGYAGSAERWLALLRGDIDMVLGTTESLAKEMQGNPEAKVMLSLTDRPNSIFPNLPYLAGIGGIIDNQTQGLPEKERQQRMHLAQLAVDLSPKPRAISITKTVTPLIRSCLIDVIEETLSSAEMKNAVANQSLDFQWSTAGDVQLLIDRYRNLVAQNNDLINEIISETPGAR